MALKHGQIAGALVKELNCSFSKPISPVLLIYDAKILGSVLYSSELWGFSNIATLTIAENTFLRSVTCLPQSTPLKPLLLDLGRKALAIKAILCPIFYWCRVGKLRWSPEGCYGGRLFPENQLASKHQKNTDQHGSEDSMGQSIWCPVSFKRKTNTTCTW